MRGVIDSEYFGNIIASTDNLIDFLHTYPGQFFLERLFRVLKSNPESPLKDHIEREKSLLNTFLGPLTKCSVDDKYSDLILGYIKQVLFSKDTIKNIVGEEIYSLFMQNKGQIEALLDELGPKIKETPEYSRINKISSLRLLLESTLGPSSYGEWMNLLKENTIPKAGTKSFLIDLGNAEDISKLQNALGFPDTILEELKQYDGYVIKVSPEGSIGNSDLSKIPKSLVSPADILSFGFPFIVLQPKYEPISKDNCPVLSELFERVYTLQEINGYAKKKEYIRETYSKQDIVAYINTIKDVLKDYVHPEEYSYAPFLQSKAKGRAEIMSSLEWESVAMKDPHDADDSLRNFFVLLRDAYGTIGCGGDKDIHELINHLVMMHPLLFSANPKDILWDQITKKLKYIDLHDIVTCDIARRGLYD